MQLNVTLDYAFFALFAVVLVGLGLHFTGNLLTGRAGKRWLRWKWPEHKGPPVPGLPKFMHFQHAFFMIVLAVTGLYIRFPGYIPLGDGGRGLARGLHYVSMVLVSLNLLWRFWFAFSSRRRDYREFAITKRDITTAHRVVLYYTFIGRSKPHLDKYNVMQKMTYIIFALLMIVQAYSGFALLTAPLIYGESPRFYLLGGWLPFADYSIDLIGWYARMVHYVVNWLFIILTTIHIYMAFTEDFPVFLDFFGLGALARRIAGKRGSADAAKRPENGGSTAPAALESE